MAKVDLDRTTLPAFIERVNRLAPDMKRKFGMEDAIGALRHVAGLFRMSLGAITIKDRTWPIVRHVMYYATFCWLTNWPEGKITGTDSDTLPSREEFDGEQKQLVALMKQFVDELERTPRRKNPHPFVGAITLKKWSRVHGMHTDSHLRQFGV